MADVTYYADLPFVVSYDGSAASGVGHHWRFCPRAVLIWINLIGRSTSALLT
jgi:hypothetical protein